MSAFKIVLIPEAQSDIVRLDSSLQTRILDKLEWMGENAQLIRHQALQGDEWDGSYKYRVGDYRIIYLLDSTAQKMTILKIGHRREVYGA
jgi:mRNA interferase RelE/StbE